MTANVNDVLVVVCFFAVTKPASICNHKKFRNHENDSLQVTLYYLNIRIIFGGQNSAANSACLIFRRIFGGQKLCGAFGYRRRLGEYGIRVSASFYIFSRGIISG